MNAAELVNMGLADPRRARRASFLEVPTVRKKLIPYIAEALRSVLGAAVRVSEIHAPSEGVIAFFNEQVDNVFFSCIPWLVAHISPVSKSIGWLPSDQQQEKNDEVAKTILTRFFQNFVAMVWFGLHHAPRLEFKDKHRLGRLVPEESRQASHKGSQQAIEAVHSGRYAEFLKKTYEELLGKFVDSKTELVKLLFDNASVRVVHDSTASEFDRLGSRTSLVVSELQLWLDRMLPIDGWTRLAPGAVPCVTETSF